MRILEQHASDKQTQEEKERKQKLVDMFTLLDLPLLSSFQMFLVYFDPSVTSYNLPAIDKERNLAFLQVETSVHESF